MHCRWRSSLDPFNRFNSATQQCLSQARTWISSIICRGLLFCSVSEGESQLFNLLILMELLIISVQVKLSFHKMFVTSLVQSFDRTTYLGRSKLRSGTGKLMLLYDCMEIRTRTSQILKRYWKDARRKIKYKKGEGGK